MFELEDRGDQQGDHVELCHEKLNFSAINMAWIIYLLLEKFIIMCVLG